MEQSPQQEKPSQPWLDREREDAFQKQIKYFEKLDAAAVRNAFLTIFNPGIPEGKQPLVPDDIKSLTYATVVSEGASEIADHEIARPFFYFRDTVEFQNFYDRLTGHLGSGGFHLPGSAFGEDAGIWNKTGIMVTTDNLTFVTHEIRHTADPYVETRAGADKMISEVFAYYQEMILDSEAGLRKMVDPVNGPWNMMRAAVTGRGYYDEYFKTEEEKKLLSYDAFKQLGAELVAAVRASHEKRGALETQRSIVQLKTIGEIVKNIK